MANVDLHALSGEGGRTLSTAWVFSGGGIDGALQAAVVARAVERRAWHPGEVRLFGTSTGAYTAVATSLWSGERDMAGRLRDLWPSIASERLILSRVQGRLIDRFVPPGLRLEDLPIPVSITVTDVEAGRREVLDRGPVRELLLAASSWPLLHTPVPVEGRLYQDGGMVAYCDLLAADEAGCKQAIAIACCNRAPNRAHHRRSRAHALGLSQRMHQMEAHLDASSMQQIQRDLLICGDRMPTLLLAPQLPSRGARISNADRIADDLELGRALADQVLDRRPYMNVLGRIPTSAIIDTPPQLVTHAAGSVAGHEL